MTSTSSRARDRLVERACRQAQIITPPACTCRPPEPDRPVREGTRPIVAKPRAS